jgi:RloB-like protein
MRRKNKHVTQKEANRLHKELQKANRRQQPIIGRNAPSKSVNKLILIVCEGRNTEPSYFNQFKLGNTTIEVIGEGKNTTSLIKRALQLKKEKQYDKVWCVFDADPKPSNPKQKSNFNRAVLEAKKNKMGVASSNQAFEYWIILHLEDHQGGKMDRKDYNDKINSLLKPFGQSYDGNGNKKITEEIFKILNSVDPITKKERVRLAINRAKRNYKLFDLKSPAKAESSTTVFLLVEELLKSFEKC